MYVFSSSSLWCKVKLFFVEWIYINLKWWSLNVFDHKISKNVCHENLHIIEKKCYLINEREMRRNFHEQRETHYVHKLFLYMILHFTLSIMHDLHSFNIFIQKRKRKKKKFCRWWLWPKGSFMARLNFGVYIYVCVCV